MNFIKTNDLQTAEELMKYFPLISEENGTYTFINSTKCFQDVKGEFKDKCIQTDVLFG